MNPSRRLILWNPDDPEFPLDAWEVLRFVYWTILDVNREWTGEEYLRALLATPELEEARGLLGGIARKHGLQDDENGRLIALDSVLIAGGELRARRTAITKRLETCEAAGDIGGQTEALRALARLEPRWFDNWQALVTHVEKSDSASAALAEMSAGEQSMRDNFDFRLELLRLICACGTREAAVAEAQRIRADLGDFAELSFQADEDYLRAWRTDSDAVRWRASVMAEEALPDSPPDAE